MQNILLLLQINKEISALLHLLDDPDENVFQTVQQKIISYGADIVPTLEAYWEHSGNEIIQNRVEEIIHTVNFKNLLHQFEVWAKSPSHDLFEAALLSSFYRFNQANENEARKTLKTIYQSTWLELNNYLSPMEQINVMSSILYNMYRISNNEIHVDNINHFFITHLLSSKNGNVYSIGLFYLILTNLLSIPIKAVNIPNQFLLAYIEKEYNYLTPTLEPMDKILFYIDPASGMVYTQNDVDAYLKKINYPIDNLSYQKPMSNKEVMKVYMKALLKCYATEDLINFKEKELLKIIDLFEE